MPGASHGTTKRLAVQRTNETLRTRDIYRGPGGGEELVCGRDQEGPPSQKHTAWPQNHCLGWGGRVGAAPVTVDRRGSHGLRLSCVQQLGCRKWEGEG